MARIIQLNNKLDGQNATVIRLAACEAVSSLYDVKLTLLTAKPLNSLHCLQQFVSTTISQNDHSRFFTGFVQTIETLGMQYGQYVYELILAPQVFCKSKGIRSKIYHNKTIRDIASDIFRQSKIEHIEYSIKASQQPIEYCVQYQQSCWDFLSELFARFGIFYFFKQYIDHHTLVIADNNETFLDQKQASLVESQLKSQRLVSHGVALSDYNHQQANKIRLQTQDAKLMAGQTILGVNNKNLLITAIKHFAQDYTGVKSHQSNHGTIQSYKNSLKAIELNTSFQPKIKPQRKIDGVQTAIVDQFKQPRVHFHWQNQAISKTARCHYQAAGKSWGHFFAKRNQQETLIHFYHNNPNQFVLGKSLSLYNGAHFCDGFKSETLNSIIYDDTKNKENLSFHAALNLTQTIENSFLTTIGQNLTETIKKGNQTKNIQNGKVIISAKQIILKVNHSEIKINPEGIFLQSKSIHLTSSNSTSLKPIARASDTHTCPKKTPSQQKHKGGPIIKGSENVLIDGKNAARENDPAHCEHDKDAIKKGAAKILINNKPAAYKDSETIHGGKITKGSKTVFVQA